MILERAAGAVWRFLRDPATRDLVATAAALAPAAVAFLVFACTKGHL